MGEPHRTIYISDRHPGSTGCQGLVMGDYLKVHSDDYLYLTVDIVHTWQLGLNSYCPQVQNGVVPKRLMHAGNSYRVVCVAASHGGRALGFISTQFGSVDVVGKAVHVNADGHPLRVIHEDYFNAVAPCAKWLALGNNAATLLSNR